MLAMPKILSTYLAQEFLDGNVNHVRICDVPLTVYRDEFRLSGFCSRSYDLPANASLPQVLLLVSVY